MNKIMKVKNFKQICEMIADATTFEQVQEIYGQIDFSFQRDKITWREHEILYHINDKVKI